MRVLLFGVVIGAITTGIFWLGDAYSVTVAGRVALAAVAIAICTMTAVALDTSRQVRRLTRGLLAATSLVMLLLVTWGLADGLFRQDEAGIQPAAVPVSIDTPIRTVETTKVVFVTGR